ncbi:MazG family protein [Microcella sp.]|uniref:MazG family protein n=1 Tax=Microcella sp. TaxID=1913979 RepID=UPI00256D8495|nr:MazG family protein [Microcella sp.]MBX9471462.1 MazG family protein [Microcella sp.]
MTAAQQSPELPAPQPHPNLDQLIAVLEHLRAPGGCAWDAEQTHESLTRYLIEEAHELVEAIEHGTSDDVLEELGDVLYQVLFHADIAAASAEHPFTIDDVAARSTAKMVGRHPHVFGDVTADTADAVAENWETWKRQEKPERASVLDGVPAGLTALSRAQKVLDKAEGVGIEVAASERVDSAVYADERALGSAILEIAAEGRRRGLDAERALRAAVRAIENKVRASEAADPSV